MDTSITLPAGSVSTTTVARHDIYHGIHKALRLMMCNTLSRVGSTDPADSDDVRAALEQVDDLLDVCTLHLEKENGFVHPALEQCLAGSARRIADEHVHHSESIADLRDLVKLVAHTLGEARHAALNRLYKALALFVAENFTHMHVEETAHNAVLWAHYSDKELDDLHQRLVASIPPAAMMKVMHGFMPGLNAPERLGMLRGMQAGMPPQAFEGVLDIARRTLAQGEFAKMARALGLPPVPGLVQS